MLKKINRIWLILLFFFISNSRIPAQIKESRATEIDSITFVNNRKILNDLNTDKFQKEVFTKDSTQIPYRLLGPKDNKPEKKFPLVIVLHNSSRIGVDNERQLEHLSRIWLREDIFSKYQCYVLAPQFNKRSSIYENRGDSVQISKPSSDVFGLIDLIKEIEQENPNIDKNRIYLVGYSMGGSTAQNLMSITPDTFAAMVSIAAVPDFSNLKKIESKNIWLIHGEKDMDNPYIGSVALYEKIKKNKKLIFTTYTNLTHHNIVIPFLLIEEIPKWLFDKKK